MRWKKAGADGMSEVTYPAGFKPYDYHFWNEPYLKTAGAAFAGVFVAFHPFRRVLPLGGEAFWWPGDGSSSTQRTQTCPAGWKRHMKKRTSRKCSGIS
jgi:hypothetical protein